jgi:hypothetical protein
MTASCPWLTAFQLYAGNKQKSYKIMKMSMFATSDKAKPDTESIRGLYLAAVRHATVQVTRMPLLIFGRYTIENTYYFRSVYSSVALHWAQPLFTTYCCTRCSATDSLPTICLRGTVFIEPLPSNGSIRHKIYVNCVFYIFIFIKTM